MENQHPLPAWLADEHCNRIEIACLKIESLKTQQIPALVALFEAFAAMYLERGATNGDAGLLKPIFVLFFGTAVDHDYVPRAEMPI